MHPEKSGALPQTPLEPLKPDGSNQNPTTTEKEGRKKLLIEFSSQTVCGAVCERTCLSKLGGKTEALKSEVICLRSENSAILPELLVVVLPAQLLLDSRHSHNLSWLILARRWLSR